MSRDFEFTVSSEHSPEEVYEALNSEEQWLARFERAQKTDGYELTRHDHGGLTVDITDEVGTSELPGFVKKVVRGRLLVTRTDSWGPFDGDRADGTLAGGATAIPASVNGTMSLRPDGTGSIITVKGTSTVKIPLIGGKIESLINDIVRDMVEQETQETHDWAAEREQQEGQD